jgi:hypothetical protein
MQLTETIVVDDFFVVEDTLPIMAASVGVRVYDYNFRNFFQVQSLLYPPSQPIVARIGAFQDYLTSYAELITAGITLVHTPEEHDRCSFLPLWYPLIADLTPKSIVYPSLPSAKVVEQDFSWPVFVKGERQTHKHKKSLSVIESREQFEQLLVNWKQDTMLHWQRMVCRQFVPLQLVEEPIADRLPSSYEFRLFYWKQQLVSIGRYWYECTHYELSDQERTEAVELANEVARCISVCFLVVDVAKTVEGKWIVIEVNDGQESGYAGINARLLWENILKIEKSLTFRKPGE